MSSSHYIRTIHTSFTAAHPSPWASAASRSSPSSFLSSSSSSPSSLHQPLYSSSSQTHQNSKSLPPTAPVHHTHLAPPASGAGGRRRAYAFRVPHSPPHQPSSSPSAYAPSAPRPKFDPFADEPTSPVPSIAHLASLSTPPTPRLAAASLPPPLSHRPGQGYAPQPRRLSNGGQGQGYQQGHGQGFSQAYAGGAAAHGPSPHYAQTGPRRSGFPGQRSRSPAPSFIIDSPSSHQTDARSLAYAAPTTEVWRSSSYTASSSAGRRQQNQVYEQEFEYDLGVPVSGGNGGLVEPITSRRIAQPGQGRVSGPAPHRSPPPPSSILARRSPSPPSARSPSSPSTSTFASQHAPRALVRTPSPPTHAPIPQQKSAAQLQAEKESRAKLVAGILLNRIHVQKRSGRRVPSPVGGGRVYVPSGLRREVLVGA